MKLKTKFQDEDFELGEVVDATISTTSLVDTHIKLKAKSKRGGEHMFAFSRISELFELFEDYEEEPKIYWAIPPGGIEEFTYDNDEIDEFNKSIGNYFKTKEEAEKAVEKLKAWKRLKDGGITFKNWTISQTGIIDCFATWGDNIPPSRKDPTLQDDLDLLFSGDEE